MLISSELEMGKCGIDCCKKPLYSLFSPIIRVVEYATYDDMKNAMKKLDGADLNGRRLKLVEDYRGRKRRYMQLIKKYTHFPFP